MSESPVHNTYDDVARELASAARRLAAPVLLAARERRMNTQRDTGDVRRETGRERATLASEAQRQQFARQLRANFDTARDR